MAEKFTVTLLGDKATGKVMYLEGGHEFVNFMISLLHIPPGAQFNVLRENSSLALPKTALGNLFSSIEKMKTPFLTAKKERILHPPINSDFFESLSNLGINGDNIPKSDSVPRYRCSRATNYDWNDNCKKWHVDCDSQAITRTKNAICPKCNEGKMDKEVEIRDDLTADDSEIPRLKDSEYVKDSVTFLVTDDLQFFPVSMIRTLTELTKAHIGRLEDLESCEIEIDEKKLLGLLKAAHESTSVLQDLFEEEFMRMVPRGVTGNGKKNESGKDVLSLVD